MSLDRRLLKLPEPTGEAAETTKRLCQIIGERIASDGPIGFDRYMDMALYHPELGYYRNGLKRFGEGGDFITAPELGSQFAECLARQFDGLQPALGGDWTLLEVGAGSGVLIRDLLGAMQHPPARYMVLESSAALRQVQRETLADLPSDLANRVSWLDAPPAESFCGVIIANEVADALPVSLFEITADGPMERQVSIDGDRLGWQLAPTTGRLAAALASLLADLPEPLPIGYRSEICLNLAPWLATVTAPLERGLALMIDYGYPRREYYLPERMDGTLVCHYRHRAHFDPLLWPGLCDISSFVDFTALAAAGSATGLELLGYTSQAEFLLTLELGQDLAEIEPTSRRLERANEVRRLVMPGELGEKFKVIGFGRDIDAALTALCAGDRRQRL